MPLSRLACKCSLDGNQRRLTARLYRHQAPSTSLPLYRKAKVKRQLPAATATYCLPLTAYVIGPEASTPPTATFHNKAPLRASNAKKYPSRPPLKSRSEAVVRMPASVTSAILNSHFFSPVLGSKARTAPKPSFSFRKCCGRSRSSGTSDLCPPLGSSPGLTGNLKKTDE